MATLEQIRLFLEEDETAQAVEELSAMQKEQLSPICLAHKSLLQGEAFLYDGDYSKASILLEEGFQMFTQLENQEGIAQSAYQLALAYIEDDNTARAVPYLDTALLYKASLDSVELLYEALDTRAMFHSSAGEHEQAMQLLKEAVIYGRRKGDTDIQGQLLNQIATNYQTFGEIDSAILYYAELTRVKQEKNDQLGLLSDYCTIGELHQSLGNYQNAQLSFIEATRYAEQLKDTISLVNIYKDIALLYLEQRLLEPALDNARTALNLAKQKNSLLSQGQCLEIIGEGFIIQTKPESALFYYQSAFDIYQSLGLKQEMAVIQLKIAGIIENEQSLEKAEVLLRDALVMKIETSDRQGELDTKLSLSNILLKRNGDTEEIRNWLKDCAMIAKEANNAKGMQEICRLNSIFYERIGNHQLALHEYRLFNQIRDSILNKENAKIVRELEERYQTEKKDKEIAVQRAEIEQQNDALRKRNTQIVQLLAGLLVLLILVFLTLITYQRNKQFNQQQLSVLEKERETQLLRAMVSGEEQERRRIARDLHDGLGAIMATVKMRVSALSNQLPAIKEMESYQKAEELIDDACVNVREISHNMMPGALSKYGLEFAVRDMCDAIQKSNNIEVSFIPFGLDKIMDDAIETNVYRVVQELLKNIIKHAQASEAIVQITLDEGILDITVEDNGKGFDLATTKLDDGIGIGSIRSRILFLNGTMDIDSSEGVGTTFMINIPIDTQSKQTLW